MADSVGNKKFRGIRVDSGAGLAASGSGLQFKATVAGHIAISTTTARPSTVAFFFSPFTSMSSEQRNYKCNASSIGDGGNVRIACLWASLSGQRMDTARHHLS